MVNFTMLGNETRLFEHFQYANEVTSGQFGNWLLVIIFAVVLIGSKRFSDERAWTIALFVTALSAFLLNRAGVVSGFAMVASLVLSGGAMLWLFFSGSKTV